MPTNTGEERKNKELLCHTTTEKKLKNRQRIKKAKIKLADVRNRCPGKNTDGTI